MGWAVVQVDLLQLAQGTAEHLATYAHMDISLDPFPYAGTTTTCESLYMGAPPAAEPTRAHPAVLRRPGVTDCSSRAAVLPRLTVSGFRARGGVGGGGRVAAGLQGCRA